MSKIDITALRTRLGLSEEELPDDATEDQVNAALAADPETPAEQAGDEEAEVNEPETPEGEAPAASSARTVQVASDVWERTQRDAAAGAAARRAQLVAELDTEADDAVREGRITPATRADWRTAIDPGENPDAAALARANAEKAALKGLAAGRVPVDGPKGTQPSASADDDLLAASRARLGIPTKKEV